MTGAFEAAGRVIAGRYRLVRRLGAGGMGRVWQAYDQELACEVALKEIILPPHVPESEVGARIARARGEAQHAARLRNHPHVVTVYDIVESGGLPWIVMEFVPGATDLEAVVRERGPLLLADVARIGLAVLDALLEGHRLGVLHRDVKPANVLLTGAGPQSLHGAEGGRVLLTDYGIALEPSSGKPRLTAPAEIIGTVRFMAPERLRGETPTAASDLFSLGGTLYFALEGCGPFDRDCDGDMLSALLSESPAPPRRAAELAPVFLGLLAKDPARRMGGDEAAELLASLAAGSGAGAARPEAALSPVLPPAGPAGRERRPVPPAGGRPPRSGEPEPPTELLPPAGGAGLPLQPLPPSEPSAPSGPSGPGEPAEPSAPAEPSGPGGPAEPSAPSGPGGPGGLSGPGGPGGLSGPGGPSGPGGVSGEGSRGGLPPGGGGGRPRSGRRRPGRRAGSRAGRRRAGLLAGVVAGVLAAGGAGVYLAQSGSSGPEPVSSIRVGDSPQGMAMSQDGRRSYVTNYGSGSVSVIDTLTNRTEDQPIRVGKNPRDVAVSPDRRRVYVTNYGSDSVSVIDTLTNRVDRTITVGSTPVGVTVSRDGRWVYVTLSRSGSLPGSLSVIDTATDKVKHTISVGKDPQGVAVAPDGRRVYVDNYGSDSVSVIDTGTDKVERTVSVGKAPLGVAVAPDGRRVYVTNSYSDSVSVIDTRADKVERTIRVGSGPRGVAVSPDRRWVYVANNYEGSVSVIDTAADKVERTISVGRGPLEVAVSPDGDRRQLHVSNFVSDSVSVIPLQETQDASARGPAGPGRAGSTALHLERHPLLRPSAGPVTAGQECCPGS
ncbi:protein kinase domain-containing protein [Streptomyces viridiviolaceus]